MIALGAESARVRYESFPGVVRERWLAVGRHFCRTPLTEQPPPPGIPSNRHGEWRGENSPRSPRAIFPLPLRKRLHGNRACGGRLRSQMHDDAARGARRRFDLEANHPCCRGSELRSPPAGGRIDLEHRPSGFEDAELERAAVAGTRDILTPWPRASPRRPFGLVSRSTVDFGYTVPLSQVGGPS
jgi:hypothetical protein